MLYIALMTILFTLYEHHVRHVRYGCLDCFSTTVTDPHTFPLPDILSFPYSFTDSGVFFLQGTIP